MHNMRLDYLFVIQWDIFLKCRLARLLKSYLLVSHFAKTARGVAKSSTNLLPRTTSFSRDLFRRGLLFELRASRTKKSESLARKRFGWHARTPTGLLYTFSSRWCWKVVGCTVPAIFYTLSKATSLTNRTMAASPQWPRGTAQGLPLNDPTVMFPFHGVKI